jgi:hypothetical protein
VPIKVLFNKNFSKMGRNFTKEDKMIEFCLINSAERERATLKQNLSHLSQKFTKSPVSYINTRLNCAAFPTSNNNPISIFSYQSSIITHISKKDISFLETQTSSIITNFSTRSFL